MSFFFPFPSFAFSVIQRSFKYLFVFECLAVKKIYGASYLFQPLFSFLLPVFPVFVFLHIFLFFLIFFANFSLTFFFYFFLLFPSFVSSFSVFFHFSFSLFLSFSVFSFILFHFPARFQTSLNDSIYGH